jgi:uncharacterized protein YggE
MHRSLLSVATLAAAGAVVLTACGSKGHSAPPAPAATTLAATTAPSPGLRTILATGDGQATGTPDTLTVDIAVQTTDVSAAQALQTNNTEAAALIAKLKADGIAPADIQTAQLNVSPNYSGPTPHITGYTVTDEVIAKIRQLDKAGQLIDDAVAAAGNDARVNSIGYSIADDSALLAAARADAVRSATLRAKAMAGAAGVTLGPVQTITDQTQPQINYPQFANASAGASSSAGAPVPFQTGQEQLSVEVQVVYTIA